MSSSFHALLQVQTKHDTIQYNTILYLTWKYAQLSSQFTGTQRQYCCNYFVCQNSATDKEGEDKEEESVEDVDLFAAAEDEKPQQEDEEETEEDLQSHNTNSKIPMAAGKGSSLFGIDDDERDDDIDDLFIPKGAVEKKKVNIEVEDNSELLT